MKNDEISQDEIMEMAIKAHYDSKTWIEIYKDETTTQIARGYLEAFAKLVAEAAASKEREACALLCDDIDLPFIASAIRERGEA